MPQGFWSKKSGRLWGESVIIRLVEFDLFTCCEKVVFDPLRGAMSIDLTRYWMGMRGFMSHDTHLIYAEWKERVIRMQTLWSV